MTKPISTPFIEDDIREWTWTLEKYHQAINIGFLTKDDQVELLFGKLIEKMPVGNLHAVCLSKINRLFHRRHLNQYELRRENPVTLPNSSEPGPDFVVAYNKDNFYADGHPTPPIFSFSSK